MTTSRLNPKQIDTLPAGTYGDGNNLYLVVKPYGSRSYMLRYSWRGSIQKMGLGAAGKIKLAEARDLAIDANRLPAKGINPREQGRSDITVHGFRPQAALTGELA